MFEECGFEIYETTGVTYSTNEIHEEKGAPAKRCFEVRDKILDSLQAR